MEETRAPCRICGDGGPHGRLVAREMMFGTREEFAYLDCRACGCLQIEEIPEDLGPFYPDAYYSFEPPQRPESWRRRAVQRARDRFEVTGKGRLGRRWSEQVPHRMLRPLRQLGMTKSTRLLDVGSGGGAYLRDLGDLGFTNLLGVDPHLPADVTHDNGVRVLRQDLTDVDGEWDVIAFHHSYEHVPDQHATLAAAAERLAPGGTILLRVPVCDSEAFERYGADWVQLDPPRHLYLHTRASIDRLAEDHDLVVKSVVHDSTAFQFSGSEHYREDVPLQGAPDFPADRVAAWEAEADALNAAGRGDQACFYLGPA